MGSPIRAVANLVAPARRFSVGVDAREPGDQATAQEREPCLAVSREAAVRVSGLERTLDGRLDGALQAAELVVVLELGMPAGVVLDVEPLQREGEERQGVLGAAGLDVG